MAHSLTRKSVCYHADLNRNLVCDTYIAKVLGSYEDEETGLRMLKVERSSEDVEYERQIVIDKIAGYLGASLVIIGTVIASYGDLLAKI